MKKFLLTVATTAVLLGLTACKKDDEVKAPESKSAAQVSVTEQAGQDPSYPTYAVGSEISYEPFSFKDELGRPIGFEVDLLQAVAKAGKFNVAFVDNPRTELVETLNNGKFVIWASALSVSPDRKEQMDFSDPYIDFVREVYILDKPENAGLQTIADLKGKKIAVNQGSKTAVSAAEEIVGSSNNVIKADSFYMSLKETYKGGADGTLGDSRILQYYQLKHPDMKTRTIPLGDARKDVAFAVKKGNVEVLNQINQGLAAIKADGTYDKLVEKWFGHQVN